MALARLSIAVVVVLTLLPSSGCISIVDDEGVDEKVVINFESPGMEPRDTGGEYVYDASLRINKITPKEVKVKWSDIRVHIKRYDGSVLVPESSIDEDTGSYGDTVEFWYRDTTGERDLASAGDYLIITGMDDTEFEGGHVYVNYKGRLVASPTLPTDFP